MMLSTGSLDNFLVRQSFDEFWLRVFRRIADTQLPVVVETECKQFVRFVNKEGVVGTAVHPNEVCRHPIWFEVDWTRSQRGRAHLPGSNFPAELVLLAHAPGVYFAVPCKRNNMV